MSDGTGAWSDVSPQHSLCSRTGLYVPWNTRAFPCVTALPPSPYSCQAHHPSRKDRFFLIAESQRAPLSGPRPRNPNLRLTFPRCCAYLRVEPSRENDWIPMSATVGFACRPQYYRSDHFMSLRTKLELVQSYWRRVSTDAPTGSTSQPNFNWVSFAIGGP